MKKLMHTLFLSCLKATELIEKKMHFRLSARERLQLKMHKMMCSACSLYEKQSTTIENGLSSTFSGEVSEEDLASFKLDIKKQLSELK